jgi:RNA polymerase sigma-70 factor (ECF subfamily)
MSRSSDEPDLVRRLRAGEPQAYEELVRENGPWMLGLARRLLGDATEAEDAVQDACLSAFRAIGSFQGTSRLGTWLHRIVVNAALMRLRGRKSLAGGALGGIPTGFLPSGAHAAPVAEWRDGSLLALEREEVRDAIREAVGALPAPYRTAFVLRDVEGLPIEEVARLLDVSVPGAKTRLHRARQALRATLAPWFAEEEPWVLRGARRPARPLELHGERRDARETDSRDGPAPTAVTP